MGTVVRIDVEAADLHLEHYQEECGRVLDAIRGVWYAFAADEDVVKVEYEKLPSPSVRYMAEGKYPFDEDPNAYPPQIVKDFIKAVRGKLGRPVSVDVWVAWIEDTPTDYYATEDMDEEELS